MASLQQSRHLQLDCSLQNVDQTVLVDVQLAGVDEGDDLLHHVRVDFSNVDTVRLAGRFQDPEEHLGPGLEDDGVAVEPLIPTLDADISILLGTQAAQGTQQSLGFLTSKEVVTV